MFNFFRKMKASTKLMLGIFGLVILGAIGFLIWGVQTGRINTSADLSATQEKTAILRPSSDAFNPDGNAVASQGTDLFMMVNEAVSDDSTYIYPTGTTASVMFGHSAVTGVDDLTIKGVKIFVRLSGVSSVSSANLLGIYNNNHVNFGAVQDSSTSISGDWTILSQSFPVCPFDNNNPWTPDNLDKMSFGAVFGNTVKGAKLSQIYAVVSYVALPAVTTNTPADVTTKSFSPHGNITSIGGSPITKRGFSVSKVKGTVQADYSDKGSFGVGEFSRINVNLAVPNTTYFVQAYAINSYGTAYGDWVEFKSISNTIGVATIKGKTMGSYGGGNLGFDTVDDKFIANVPVNLSNNVGFTKTVYSGTNGEFQFDQVPINVTGGYKMQVFKGIKFNDYDCVRSNGGPITLYPSKSAEIIIQDYTGNQLEIGLVARGRVTDRETNTNVGGGALELFINAPKINTFWTRDSLNSQKVDPYGEFRLCLADVYATAPNLAPAFLQISTSGYYSINTPLLIPDNSMGIAIGKIDDSWLKVLKLKP